MSRKKVIYNFTTATIPVFDKVQGGYLVMDTQRAIYNLTVNPDRFSLTHNRSIKMSPRKLTTSKPKTLKMETIKGPRKGKGVQAFSAFQSEQGHRKLTDYFDRQIYIVKIEPLHSEEYGEGYKLYFKETPKGKETLTAAIFGQYVVPQLDDLYQLSHQGKLISLDSPVETTIRKAGKTYHFE